MAATADATDATVVVVDAWAAVPVFAMDESALAAVDRALDVAFAAAEPVVAAAVLPLPNADESESKRPAALTWQPAMAAIAATTMIFE